jgi:hypothetical protein
MKKPQNGKLFCVTFSAFLTLALNGCSGASAETSPAAAEPESTPSETATDKEAEQFYKGSPDLNKYVVQFVDDAKAEGVDVVPHTKGPQLTVQVASLSYLSAATIGLCELTGTRRDVTFDTRFWNAASETSRQILVHHELGHCVLRRNHSSAVRASGAMASIMTPYILAAAVFSSDRSYYIGELFANMGIAKNTDEKGLNESAPDATHICNEADLVAHERAE